MAKKFPRLVLSACLLTGAGITIWPVVENLQNDGETIRTAVEYEKTIQLPAAQSDSPELAAAREYNATLDANLLYDPWGEDPAHAGEEYAAYQGLLAQSDVMATIRIPVINLQQPIVHGTDEQALFSGVGHLYGTALPVGGESTHAVLAGHHTWPGHTFFSNLEDVEKGDQFFIDVYGETLAYEVDQTQLVYPNEIDQVKKEEGQDLVTLVTCITPEGGVLNQYRLLVRGHRIPTPPEFAAVTATGELISQAPVEIQQWMWPRIIIAGLAMAIFLGFLTSWIRADLVTRKNSRVAGKVEEAEDGR